jgi:hypothetical protein
MEIKQYTIKHLKEIVENRHATNREKLEALRYLIDIESQNPGDKIDE